MPKSTTSKQIAQVFKANVVAAIFLVEYDNSKTKTKYHQVSDMLAAGTQNLNSCVRGGR